MTSTATATAPTFKGNDRVLFGMVLGVLTFWLFAQTMQNLGPQIGAQLGVNISLTTAAISLSALFSGMFIVVLGNLGDRFGRVRLAVWGNALNILGSLLIGLAFGHPALATAMLLIGRILQGLSAGAIMPTTMALLRTYWQGRERQRAVSLWSMGTWGGNGLAAIFGGLLAGSFLGWRSIFFLSAAVSVVSILLIFRMPESRPNVDKQEQTDWPGIITLAIAVLSLLIVVTQGTSIGWLSPVIWVLIAVAVVMAGSFVFTERRAAAPLIDFSLLRNRQYTGAVISNLLLNATAGLITVSLWVFQARVECQRAPLAISRLAMPFA